MVFPSHDVCGRIAVHTSRMGTRTMSDKSVSISVEKHDGSIIDHLVEISPIGPYTGFHADRYDATVTVGERSYSGSGKSYDDAVSSAKHEAGID